MNEAQASTLRDVLDRHHHALSDDLAALLDSNLRNGMQAGRRETADSLNQALRRIRQAESPAQVLDVLRSAGSGFGSRTVVLAVQTGQDGVEARLVGEVDPPGGFSLSSAPAVRSLLDTKDPVVTLASESELGSSLAALLNANGGKAYLFPVTVRQEVTGILILTGDVLSAPPELLCEGAGLRLEVLTAPLARPMSSLLQIQPTSIPASSTSSPRIWDELSAEDQRLHLQAQRVARVKVAGMRLEHSDALRRGASESKIYEALRPQIEAARAEFLQSFLAKSDTMVDYLHLEIMRSLAHDDDRLLGKDYPGPMV